MSDGEALVRPRMCDFRLWKELVRDLPDPFPCHGVFLAAPSERAQKEPDYVASEHIQRLCIRRHCMVVEVSPDNLSQPFADYGNRQVHVASQDFLDLPELRAHAVLAGLSLDGELPHSAFSADEREAQKVESLRFPQPLLLSAGRRRAAKLDQSAIRRGLPATASKHSRRIVAAAAAFAVLGGPPIVERNERARCARMRSKASR